MTPTERKAREEGFCIENVKEQVGCVMDRLDQRWLRDRNRNKSFVKIVVDTRNDGEILIAESEDFIFLYNNKSQTLDHCWMKRGRKAVTEKERGVIGPLNCWMKRGRKAVTERERGVIGPLNCWMKRGRKAVTERERGDRATQLLDEARTESCDREGERSDRATQLVAASQP